MTGNETERRRGEPSAESVTGETVAEPADPSTEAPEPQDEADLGAAGGLVAGAAAGAAVGGPVGAVIGGGLGAAAGAQAGQAIGEKRDEAAEEDQEEEDGGPARSKSPASRRS